MVSTKWALETASRRTNDHDLGAGAVVVGLEVGSSRILRGGSRLHGSAASRAAGHSGTAHRRSCRQRLGDAAATADGRQAGGPNWRDRTCTGRRGGARAACCRGKCNSRWRCLGACKGLLKTIVRGEPQVMHYARCRFRG